jgi:DNA-directed RNA polymerase subunit RPC12/RpoP
MKLIKYVCMDCSVNYPDDETKGFEFYLEPQHDFEHPYCPNCKRDYYTKNLGEIDAKEL